MPDGSRMSVYTSSSMGEPHTTRIGLSVVCETAARSTARGRLSDATAPVIGQMRRSTFGSATMASMICRPAGVDTGGPPESMGLDTRR